ncbi:STAS domain-containing protein [Thiorhodospira sibirica]|uniref:STAS domain-containing protein n=1 Tax=Thiorhodospira sibirica TaxID=154347 RepID=UPI00022C0AC8|nr:STAS domain-containing protein [Thiorhodospira sibirica]
MSIERRVEDNGKRLVIVIQGRFDFSQHKAFRDAYKEQTGKVHEYLIDLSGASYLDSSALGMLLLLRERAGDENAKVSIKGATSEVRRVLDIANFGRLFTIL